MSSSERGNRLLRALDRYAGIPLAGLTGFLRRHARLTERCRGRPRICVLCLGGIGDLLLVSALTSGIRSQCPQAWLEIVGSASNAAALPLNPHADSCFHAPVRRADRLLRHIRSRSYDILFDASQWARLGAVLANLSGASLTAGFRAAGQYRAYGYDLAVEHSAQVHELENFLALGRVVWPGLAGEPGLRLPPVTPKKSGLVYLHLWPAPGPGRLLKEWPLEYWRELAAILVDRGYGVRLTGSPADAPACAAFKASFFPQTETVQSCAGLCGLVELAASFANAAAVISVNTGIMHLAALAGAPLIALHGATNPERWGPVGKNAVSLLPRSGDCAYLNLGHEYPPHVEPAMRNLPVEDVVAALDRLLGPS